MPQVKMVKSIQEATSTKGTTYWKVTWADDKIDNIFDNAMIQVCYQAQQENKAVNIVKEKSGKYFNVTEIKLVTAEDLLPPQPMPTKYPDKPQESVQPKTSPVKVESGRITQADSRNRPFCMSYAKDVLVAKIAAGLVKDITKIEVEKMINLADTMLRWIDNEPSLVTVAKEHGAKEVNEN